MAKMTAPESRTPKTAVPLYKRTGAPAALRVKDLLARMTLEEKASQMLCVWQEKAQKLVDATGNFDPAKARAAFKKGLGLGQVGRPSDAGASPGEPWKGQTARGMAKLTNAIQTKTSCSGPSFVGALQALSRTSQALLASLSARGAGVA